MYNILLVLYVYNIPEPFVTVTERSMARVNIFCLVQLCCRYSFEQTNTVNCCELNSSTKRATIKNRYVAIAIVFFFFFLCLDLSGACLSNNFASEQSCKLITHDCGEFSRCSAGNRYGKHCKSSIN